MRQQATAREEAFVNLVATVASDQQSAAGVRQVKVRSATQRDALSTRLPVVACVS